MTETKAKIEQQLPPCSPTRLSVYFADLTRYTGVADKATAKARQTDHRETGGKPVAVLVRVSMATQLLKRGSCDESVGRQTTKGSTL